jgi:hypothetical protein
MKETDVSQYHLPNWERRGREQALAWQEENGSVDPEWYRDPQSPAGQQRLLEYASDRARYRHDAAQGNQLAEALGAYLDGFLSIWD